MKKDYKKLWTISNRVPDPDDEPFLEIVIAGKAAYLITGNKAHYPRQFREGIKVLSPSEFINFYRKREDTKEPQL